ncbi:hypothetical protein KKF34_07415 [Myxococcota bacterium]|nr:hypothetical protein [Myxococcota bacterium]MBU1382882.1 hypothetical protein [Myxococcota bacterium]MBU1496688.1 hypothetical protein [Myxococcota bacterium]
MSKIMPKLREIQDVVANIEGQASHLTWLLNDLRSDIDSMGVVIDQEALRTTVIALKNRASDGKTSPEDITKLATAIENLVKDL